MICGTEERTGDTESEPGRDACAESRRLRRRGRVTERRNTVDRECMFSSFRVFEDDGL